MAKTCFWNVLFFLIGNEAVNSLMVFASFFFLLLFEMQIGADDCRMSSACPFTLFHSSYPSLIFRFYRAQLGKSHSAAIETLSETKKAFSLLLDSSSKFEDSIAMICARLACK